MYPAHGVGKIVALEEQEIAGAKLELFVIDFEKDKMRLRVPLSKCDSVGMRKLSDKPMADDAMKVLTGKARVKRTMWSRRAQEYEAKINSGDLIPWPKWCATCTAPTASRNSPIPNASCMNRRWTAWPVKSPA